MVSARRLKDTFFRPETDLTLRGHRKEADAYHSAFLQMLGNGGSVEVLVSTININEHRSISKDVLKYVFDNDISVRWQVFSIDQGKYPF